MNSFFDAQVLKQIIENESDPKNTQFLTNDFCNELLKCRKNIQKMVDREKHKTSF